MSSALVQLGVPGFAHYAASKAALIGMTTVLARELGPDGVRVNCIAPGLVLTEEEQNEQILSYHQSRASTRPVRKIERPEDVAETVVFLCSLGSDFITGQVIVVDGGMALRD
jgi:NAD(P)-dependent dehydrogenase (short-subunit alcohol dehydrogenase family)